MTIKKTKGIGLLSGGLDSILAAKILLLQDIEVIGVTCKTFFFGADAGMEAAAALGIPHHVIDLGEKHLAMLKKPVYGYGRWMNPCIDCHALMLQETGRFMEEQGADFLFTGEVLGQRPMSQRRNALQSVENLAGYAGRILRPLSARLLPPTIPEVQGLIDRERLLDIQGRSRKPQMALAARFGITKYPQPGGGCILTKEGFGKKLSALLHHFPESGAREVELLKWGRHFLLPGGSLYVIGRNEADNSRLQTLAQDDDVVVRAADHPGPTGLLLPSIRVDEDLETALAGVIAYSDAPPGKPAAVEWRHEGKTETASLMNPGKDSLRRFQI